MKKYDWKTSLTVTLCILKCIGLWPEKFYTCNFYTLYAIFVAIVIVAGHNLSQIINIFFVYTDLEALTATIFVLTTNILATIKMCLFVRNLKVIKQLFAVLDRDQFQPKSAHQRNLLQPSLKFWKVSFVVFHTVVALNVTLWSISPLTNEEQKLPFLAWYPFNIDISPNYNIVYMYQVTGIWYVTSANISLDTMTYAFFMYTWSQCDILCDDLSNLDGTVDEFKKKLEECVNHHKEIVR